MRIEAKSLSKIYGGGENRVVALDRADLTAAPGDFISIMGPSGSGKSTLLHLLSGLDRPTSGSVAYDGQEIYTLPDKELSAFRRRRIGFVFQQFNLLPVLTARENILMPLLLDRKQPDERHLNRLAELLGIQDRLDHLPRELSGGQKAKLLLTKMVLDGVNVLILDEPTRNFSPISGPKVREALRAYEGTVISVSHDRKFLTEVCDKLYRFTENGLVLVEKEELFV